jgi:hypothetical protein
MSPLEIVRKHRTETKHALDAALRQRDEAVRSMERLSGAVAALELLLQKLEALEPVDKAPDSK